MTETSLSQDRPDGADIASRRLLFDEIGRLTAQNRVKRNVRRERRLIELRHEAAATMVPAGPAEWPPRVPDPFPGCDGVPEIEGRELTASYIAGAIQHHGALIARRLLPQHHVRRLVDDIDRTADAIERYFKEPDSRDALAAWFDPFCPEGADAVRKRLFALRDGGIFAADSPHTFFDITEMFDEVGVVEMVEEHLGERPASVRAKAGVMRRPPDCNTGWHQDGSFLGTRIRTVNMWAAFSRCGVDAPGLEFVPRRFDTILDGFDMNEQLIQDLLDETPSVQPEFDAGDVMFFDNYFVHRTGVQPGMTKARYGLEWWFFAPTNYPRGDISLAL